MNKKYNYSEIKEDFANAGCELLEREYKNCETPMQYKCKCGSISKIAYRHFRKGVRCRNCSHKLSFEEVKNCFTINECEMLQDYYIDNNTPIKFKCKCGNVASTRLRTFKKTHGCIQCGYKKTHASVRTDKNFIINFFASQGCKLLEEDYKNNRTPMRYRCICGNESKIMWQSFYKGQRCKECQKVAVSGSNSSCWIADRQAYLLNKKFRSRCRGILHRLLGVTNQIKNTKTTIMLGYSFEEFKNRIINHPNWGKIKNKEWTIDHIYPIAAFIKYGIMDIKLINSLDNLQPLLKSENCKKHTTYDEKEFKKWLINMGDFA